MVMVMMMVMEMDMAMVMVMPIMMVNMFMRELKLHSNFASSHAVVA
jgi:hypothetical protein